MGQDFQAYYGDLKERLDALFQEIARLEQERARLLDENKALREEATLARLFRDLGGADEESAVPPEERFALPARVPREAMHFYHGLPADFNVVDFFRAAERQEIGGETARGYLLVFFREKMLLQRGARIEKTGAMPYPRPLVR